MAEFEHQTVAVGYTVTGEIKSGAFYNALLAKRIEPIKRNKDGIRWISHRFPIKGGISQMEANNRDLIELINRPNPLLNRLGIV